MRSWFDQTILAYWRHLPIGQSNRSAMFRRRVLLPRALGSRGEWRSGNPVPASEGKGPSQGSEAEKTRASKPISSSGPWPCWLRNRGMRGPWSSSAN